VLASTACIALAGLTGCGTPKATTEAGNSSSSPQQLLLVSYAVTKAAYDRILPAFEADWKARTGQSVSVKTSYGGSGSQTRAVIDGLEADVVGLALGGDVLKLQKAGLIEAGWDKELPHDSTITHSVVALITREGNPKGIRTWKDLGKAGVSVVTANPKTSGGARWNFLALWGSASRDGGSEAQARAFVGQVYGNVESLPRDAREASDVFLKRGQGDVLMNYENEAIQARKSGELTQSFLVPEQNIRIDAPIAVVDRNVDKHGTRKAAEALATFLQSEKAQTIFAEEGFRPVNETVWTKVKDRFAPVPRLFSVADFGGWEKVNATFFGDDGLWDQLFRQRRG
jgi:sulfate transport system substrate-binding protein